MNCNLPIVSIGIPVYNGSTYIQEAIESLLNQTFTDFELIISDNASTDETETICQEYAAKDERIRYYRHAQNCGSTWNFNYVFTLAKGQYFKWTSYDDLHLPTYLEKCVALLEHEPSVILCYPQSNLINAEGKYKGNYTKNLNYRSPIPHQRFYQLLQTYGWYHGTQIYGLFRSSALRKTALLPNYPHDDRVLLAELSLLGEFAEVPEYLFSRRIHSRTAQVANNTDETLSVWLDPRNQDKLVLSRWRRYLGYCQAIQKHELNLGEKALCYLQIFRRLFLSPGLLVRLQGMFNELLKLRGLFFKKFLRKPSENLNNKIPQSK